MSERDRPADDEIKVTEEMAAAGVGAFYRADRRFDSTEEIVASIYRAMVVIDPKAPPSDGNARCG